MCYASKNSIRKFLSLQKLMIKEPEVQFRKKYGFYILYRTICLNPPPLDLWDNAPHPLKKKNLTYKEILPNRAYNGPRFFKLPTKNLIFFCPKPSHTDGHFPRFGKLQIKISFFTKRPQTRNEISVFCDFFALKNTGKLVFANNQIVKKNDSSLNFVRS